VSTTSRNKKTTRRRKGRFYLKIGPDTMNFDLTEEQRMIVSTAKKMMEKEIRPVLAARDRFQPLNGAEARDILKRLIPLGYLGAVIPEEDGGAGLDYLTCGLMYEQLEPEIKPIVFIHGFTTANIYQFSTPSQRARYLPDLLAANKIACSAITEPNVGSNPAAIETTAVKDGEDYVINGTKTFITNGWLSDIAVVVASVDRSLGGRGLTRFIVDREQSPYQVRNLDMMSEHSYVAELVFEDCRVPGSNVLGKIGSGLQETLRSFEIARCMVALMAVSLAQTAMDAAVKYAKERLQFGRPIGSFQLIQEMIADMVADIEAARMLAYRGLYLVDKGVRCVKETSLAKAYATEAAVRVTSQAIQIHGGYGLSREYPLEQYFREARSLTIPDGATQIQKLTVAREILGINAFR